MGDTFDPAAMQAAAEGAAEGDAEEDEMDVHAAASAGEPSERLTQGRNNQILLYIWICALISVRSAACAGSSTLCVLKIDSSQECTTTIFNWRNLLPQYSIGEIK